MKPPAMNARPPTHMRQSSEENKLDATDDIPPGGKNVPTAVDGAWHIALHAEFWCAASTCSMGTKHFMTCSKKTQTQRQGTLFLHTCIAEPHDGAGSGTLVPGQRPGRSMDRAGPSSGSLTVNFVFHDGSTKLFKRTKYTEFSWSCGHVHRCCCLCTFQSNKNHSSLHVHPCAVARSKRPPHRSWRQSRSPTAAPAALSTDRSSPPSGSAAARHFFGDIISCPLPASRQGRSFLVRVLATPASDTSEPSRFLQKCEDALLRHGKIVVRNGNRNGDCHRSYRRRVRCRV